MAFYCITTSVKTGSGSITQIGDGVAIATCLGVPKGPAESGPSCAVNYEHGRYVQIIATPDSSNGWVVVDWEMTDSSSGVIISGYFDGVTSGATSVSVAVPSFDVNITVSFAHSDVNLILIPMTNGGCIQLVSPTGSLYDNNCYSSPTSQLLPASQVIVGAIPISGYQISSWDVDGSPLAASSTISVNLVTSDTFVTVRVWFEIADPCDTNTLEITIVGGGSVSLPSGEYCENDILSLNPVPYYGYFFKSWEYSLSSGIYESGIALIIPMSSDRSVTAIFERIPNFIIPDDTLFYCSSTTDKNSVVSFNFTNNNPSVSGIFHFRINFYSDYDRTKLLYSASTLSSSKRWFYNDMAYMTFPSDGISVDELNTIEIIYDPEILPQQIRENQVNSYINGVNTETPLVTGVKYYIEVESYDVSLGSFNFEKIITIVLDGDDVDSHYWNYNKDANNWICSGQGKMDLQVSSSSTGQSIMSDSESNIHGLFQIVWQSTMGGQNQVYGAIWDSKSDNLFSSAQGRNDELKLVGGYYPIILSDQVSYFYISAHTASGSETITNAIKMNACPLPASATVSTIETESDIFAKICGPGERVEMPSSHGSIVVRVREEDINSSIVINSNKVVPVVTKTSINIDVLGVSGSYAVRLRNSDDYEWGGWINIDNKLYYAGARNSNTTQDDDFITSDDLSYNAYRIDNDRFIVPWELDKKGGLKRICCQVLTMYGITNTFCIDVFCNLSVPRHIFKFYKDSEYKDEFPIYNGQYVLSVVNTTNNIVYFKAIFSEDVTPTDGLTFNVIQQGINDSYALSGLEFIGDKTFTGSFVIQKDDGIFNKDGNSFIEIIFPDGSSAYGCDSKSDDIYNLMVSDQKASEYKDLTPEEVYNKIKTDNVGKAFDINKFKQYYAQDDQNFKFGNPGYFRG